MGMEKEAVPMDKYELFAVSHHYDGWPINISFDEFITALYQGTDFESYLPSIRYEGIPPDDMAELIENMVSRLRSFFK